MMVRVTCLTPSPGLSGTSISHKMPDAWETPKSQDETWPMCGARKRRWNSSGQRTGSEGWERPNWRLYRAGQRRGRRSVPW